MKYSFHDDSVRTAIEKAIADNAMFVLNDSGGKDSQAMRIALRGVVPSEQMVVIHATLDEVEWPGTMEHARDGARRDSLWFYVVRARKTFFQMVERRYLDRPDVPSWPSNQYRQCTSDLKRDPIAKRVRALAKERGVSTVVNCMALRAEESSGRRKKDVLKRNARNCTTQREWWDWLPIHGMTTRQVFDTIRSAGEEPHWAYAAGNERLSCMFCIMGSKCDLQNAARHNPALLQRYIELEERTGYTMHASRVPLRVLVGQDAKGAG